MPIDQQKLVEDYIDANRPVKTGGGLYGCQYACKSWLRIMPIGLHVKKNIVRFKYFVFPQMQNYIIKMKNLPNFISWFTSQASYKLGSSGPVYRK